MSGAGPGSSSAPPPKNAAEHAFSSRNNLWLDRRGEALPRPYPATPRVDRNREANGQFILTGSQKLSLMREVSDSLAGRCGLLELEALSVNELGEVFEQRESVGGIGEVLVRGFMPQLWKDIALLPADSLRRYQATYLERDVGLLCFLLGLNRQVVTQSYLIGAIWETFVFGELRKYLRVEAPEASLWFYRDQSREVDFVIDRNGELTLAQSKRKEIPTERDFRQAFQAHPLLPRASWPVMVLCRTRQSHPVAKNALAVNAYRMREHI